MPRLEIAEGAIAETAVAETASVSEAAIAETSVTEATAIDEASFTEAAVHELSQMELFFFETAPIRNDLVSALAKSGLSLADNFWLTFGACRVQGRAGYHDRSNRLRQSAQEADEELPTSHVAHD